VTGPTVEPITLEEAKDHLRESDDSQDTLIEALIQASREYVEEYTGRRLITQTWRMTLDGFPCASRRNLWSRIEIPNAPLQSVTSISYTDTAGATQTVATSVYSVDVGTTVARGFVRLKYDQAWPDARYGSPDAVTITYVVGYGSSGESVPSAIRQAMLLIVGGFYEQRESVITGTIVADHPAVVSLLSQYRLLEAA
jgi:uncharacterized phiE125 gp8 family phage protein